MKIITEQNLWNATKERLEVSSQLFTRQVGDQQYNNFQLRSNISPKLEVVQENRNQWNKILQCLENNFVYKNLQ